MPIIHRPRDNTEVLLVTIAYSYRGAAVRGAYFGVEHDFRSPVPAGGHVLGQEAGVIVVRVGHAGQTKVTDLKKKD